MTDPRIDLLLALADDELVIGHRHAQWTGVAPHLEEDLAFSSIAQDEIGHAVVWYRLAAEVAGASGVRALAPRAPEGGDATDALAFGREPSGYRHAVLVERPNGDWAYTVARHYLYDTAEDIRLDTLAQSAWQPIADATGALRREERYHLMHARAWITRLAEGGQAARSRLTEGLSTALAQAHGLFEAVGSEDALVADGVLVADHAAQRQRWLELVAADLREVGLAHLLDEVPADGGGGRHGQRGPDFAELHQEMTGMYLAHPGARW